MPTITIDLPDNVTLPVDWDAQAFVLSKMYESGLIASPPAAQFEEKIEEQEDDEIDDDPDSWFTLEQRKQFKENRRRLEEELKKNPPKMSREERAEILRNMGVPDEETIKRQDEVREHMKQWKIRW